MRYDDFVLQLERFEGTEFRARVVRSPAGEGSAIFEKPTQGGRLGGLLAGHRGTPRGAVPEAAKRHVEILAPAPVALDPGPEELGERLFEELFTGQVRSLLDQSLGMLQGAPDRGLRIKLKVDPGDEALASLGSLPWELLRRRDTEDYLCLSRHSPLVRYLDVPRPVRRRPLPKPMRVLVAIASPADLPPLKLLQEEENLRRIRQGLEAGVEFQVIERATAAKIRTELLRRSYHALHFMGHGDFDPSSGEGLLFFETEGGKSEPTSGRALATKLKDFSGLSLVFLNACNTAQHSRRESHSPFAGVATALVLGGLPAVVAMQAPIADDAAICFSQTLYQRLAKGEPLDLAMTEARQSLHSADPTSAQWATPVLYLRVPDGNLFETPDDVGGAWARFRPRLGAAGLALALTLLPLAVSPTLRIGLARWVLPMPRFEQRGNLLAVELSHEFSSSLEALNGRVAGIELMDDGRMRLLFEFLNDGKEEVDLDFDLGKTYLADEYGNRYGVLDFSGKDGDGEELSDRVAAGEPMRKWFEFSAPVDQAREFQIGLVAGGEEVSFPMVPLELPAYPESYSVPSSPEEFPADAHALEAPRAVLASDVEGFVATIAAIELLSEERMRWRVAFFNGSAADQTLSLHYDRIYLADEFGNRYPAFASSTGASSGGAVNAWGGLIQRAVRMDTWFEFPSPIGGAREFRFVLAGDGGRGPRFTDFELQVGEYPARYTVDPPTEPLAPGARRFALGQTFPSSLEGFEGVVETVDLLGNGRMRWRMSFWNRTSQEVELRLSHRDTEVEDDTGKRYPVLRGSTGSGRRRGAPERVDRGVRTHRWLELGPPEAGRRSFQVRLASDVEGGPMFPPFELGPLEIAPRAAKKPPPATSPPPAVVPRPSPPLVPEPERMAHWSVEEGETQLASSLEGFEGKIVAFSHLSSGRLRVEGVFYNRTGAPVAFQFRPEASALVDEKGIRYRVLNGGTASSSPSLGMGRTLDWWLEFSSPRGGVRRFILVVGGDGSSGIRFKPLQVELERGG